MRFLIHAARACCISICTILALFLSNSPAQVIRPSGASSPDSSLQYAFWSRYNLSKVGSVGLVGGSFAYAAGVWWVNDFRSFHLDPSRWWDADMGVDKEGHFFTCYFMFRAINDILLWGGHDSTSAFWWSLGVAGLYGPAIEIGDGFSPYGFDIKDVTFDLLGVAFAALQNRVRFLHNIELKWSLYYPLNRHAFKINELYDYHVYWMSARVHNFLPDALSDLWPEFLQMSFGVGTMNHQQRTYLLAFDYNLEKIPVDGQDVNLLKKLLNMIHLPAPGVKFTKGHSPEWSLLLLH